MVNSRGLVHHRRRPRHGRRHRAGCSRRRTRGRRDRPRRRAACATPSASTTNLLAVSLDITDPDAAEPPPGRPSSDSVASTCSSTTRATSTPATSRTSAPSSSARRWRPTSSARSTSPARSFRSCAQQRGGQVITITLDRRTHRRRSSAPPTPRRSSRSKAGWSRSRYDVDAVRHHDDGRRARASSAPSCSSRASSTIWPELVDRRLRRAHRSDHRGVDGHERPAGRRPGQARRGARHPLATPSEPPLRFLAGADAIETGVEQKAKTLLQARPTRTASCPARSLFDDAIV